MSQTKPISTPSLRILRMLAAAAVALAFFTAAPALAGDDTLEIIGSCTGASDWSLKAKTENFGLEVDFEVDQNISGQEWRVRIVQNGVVIFQGTEVTIEPSGSFSVELLTDDLAGDDRFQAMATNPATGERCRGRLIFPEN